MKSITISFRIPEDLLKRTDALAKRRRANRTQVIVESLSLALGPMEINDQTVRGQVAREVAAVK